MSDWRFTPTDACRQVRRRIVVRLVQDIERLPAERLSSLVSWVLPNDPAVEQPQWRKIAEGLERRWAAEPDPRIKNQLASPLLQVLSARLTAEEHLKFLRRQLAEGPQVHRANFARQLFDALLSQPWSEELEREAFSLLPGLSDAEDPAERLQSQAAALVRLTDGMVQARNAALMARVEHPENLTRTELRAKQQANLRTAREQFADRLQQSTAGLPEALAPWIEIEVLHLNVLLGRDLDKVREACWERLGARPQPLSDTDPIQAELDDLLRHRRLVIVAYLATRRSAAPADAQRLLAYLDHGIETAGEDGERFAWQMFKYQLLVALDRPQELEQVLSTWIKPQDADNYWRRSLAYLQAEQARLREAIALLEQVEAADELLPADYRALAGWYQATGDRDRHERALIASFKATEEWQLSNWLYGQLRPWQQPAGQMPDELNPDVLRVFAALFQKSAQPQNYLGQLREFYRSTRDFRLLAGLADAVIGHTAGKVYPFLQGMQQVLDEVRDEATADSLVERIAAVRQRAKTVVDQRALDLLEVLVERRSSEVLNQPGPHVERALAAMQRAFRREWSAGEPRLAADLLAGLGRIAQKPLADEQLRELETLHQQSAATPAPAAAKEPDAGRGTATGPASGSRHGRPPAHRPRVGPRLLELRPASGRDRPVGKRAGGIPHGRQRRADRRRQRAAGHVRQLPCRARPFRPRRTGAAGGTKTPRPPAADLLAPRAAVPAVRRSDRQRRRRHLGPRGGSVPGGQPATAAGSANRRPEPSLPADQPFVQHLPHGPQQAAAGRARRSARLCLPAAAAGAGRPDQQLPVDRQPGRQHARTDRRTAARLGVPDRAHRARAALVPAEQPGRLEPAQLSAGVTGASEWATTWATWRRGC